MSQFGFERRPNTGTLLRLKGAGNGEDLTEDEDMESTQSLETELRKSSGVILGFISKPEDGDEPPAPRF